MAKLILEFYPFDFDYIVGKDNIAVVRLFGVTADGKRIVVLDDSVKPYFYVICKPEKANQLKEEIENLEVVSGERKVTV